MYKKILVPTDGSEASFKEVISASNLLAEDGEIIVLSVAKQLKQHPLQIKKDIKKTNETFIEYAKENVEEMKKKFDSNIKVSTKVVVGFPAEAICDVAEKEGVELIVISSAGERGFSKRIIGSVAGKVCSISNINVLLISNEEKELIKHSTTKKSDNENNIIRDYTRFRNDLYVLLRFISVEKRLNSDHPEEIIDSIERRIKYLDLIYKTLNAHSESEYVNAKEYFKKYGANFYSLYKNKQPGIEFVNKSEDNFNIPDNIITPLTSIINELIVNSLKFAYEDYDVEKKIITERVTKNDDICEVFYKDNGKGLPDDFDKDNPTGLGWTIINALVKQLDGEVKAYNSDGMCFEMKFKL